MKFAIDLAWDKLLCSELSLKDYKEILKVIYGDEPSKEIFLETITDLLSILTNKEQDYFKNLNIFQLLIVLIDIRIQSMGDTTNIVLTKDGNKKTLELRLDWIKEDLASVVEIFDCHIIEQKTFEVVLGLPSAKRLFHPISDEYLYFIKAVRVKETDAYYPILDNETAKSFFEKLPAKTAASIISYFEEFVLGLKKVNFLSRYNIDDQVLFFIPSVDSLIWFLKIMFNESIETFYENIFYLSYYGHMDGRYLNECTPGEYTYFAKKLQEMLANQKSTQPFDDVVEDTDANLPDDLQDDFATESWVLKFEE